MPVHSGQSGAHLGVLCPLGSGMALSLFHTPVPMGWGAAPCPEMWGAVPRDGRDVTCEVTQLVGDSGPVPLVHAQSPHTHLGTSDFAKGTDGVTAVGLSPRSRGDLQRLGFGIRVVYAGPRPGRLPAGDSSAVTVRLQAQGAMTQDEEFGGGGGC